MKYILGIKVNMMQYFTENGLSVPVTAIMAGPVVITQIKSKESDSYDAVQVGYGTQKKERVAKARLGQMKGMGPFRFLKEFRFKTSLPGDVKIGDSLDVSQFSKGDSITVTGISKAKGFQGVVKRHGFHGGPRSHGQKHSEREPGSIGGGLRNRVPKGMRMAGRTGGDTITVKNLKVVDIDTENNILLVKGAVPGRRGTLLAVQG
jgi:large subunit ribosomal protein L3